MASIEDLVVHIVAREVAYGFEMARSIGYRMPIKYDVGFKRVADNAPGGSRNPRGEHVRFRIRVADATSDVRVLVPHLNGRISIVEVDRLWKVVMQDLTRTAQTMAHVWIDKHPEARVEGAAAEAALAKIGMVTSDKAQEHAWSEAIRAKVQASTFSRIQRCTPT